MRLRMRVRQARTVCGVCARQLAKYSCPRCNSRTCSLECYKAHSPRCTEEFARDSTLDAMKGARTPRQLRTATTLKCVAAHLRRLAGRRRAAAAHG